MSLISDTVRRPAEPASLVVGLGDLGGRIAHSLQRDSGYTLGMRRSLTSLGNLPIQSHDATTPWPDLPIQPSDVVLCLSPDNREADAYERAYLQVANQAMLWLSQNAPRAHIWLISSTAVYAQAAGERVDEQSPARPERAGARIIRRAEQLWSDSGFAFTTLRPAGLYGPGREWMIREAQQGYSLDPRQPVWTNRIHIADAAAAVAHLVHYRRRTGAVPDTINLCDRQSATRQEILTWLQKEMGVQVNTERSVKASGKRVSSDRLAELGFTWSYPDYRTGYREILAERSC